MEKNTKPYSEPHSLRLAFASDFETTAIVDDKWLGNFRSNRNWVSISEVPGSLKPGCTSDEAVPAIYTINIKFRVSYDTEKNRKEIIRWTKAKLIATYITASGAGMVAGSKQYPLTMSVNKVDGFDGYECILKGVQTTPESFI